MDRVEVCDAFILCWSSDRRTCKKYTLPSKFNIRMKNKLLSNVCATVNMNTDVGGIIISYLVNDPYTIVKSNHDKYTYIDTYTYHERLNGRICGMHVDRIGGLVIVISDMYGNNSGESFAYTTFSTDISPPTINGVSNGMHTGYDNDENVGYVYYTVNGKLHGKYERYHENGRLAKQCYYANGELHGDYHEWYENGRPKVYRVYRNGKCVG